MADNHARTLEQIQQIADATRLGEIVDLLTGEEAFLLGWLGAEDSSQLGECYGSTLDRLVELGIARIDNPERGMHARVYLTDHILALI